MKPLPVTAELLRVAGSSGSRSRSGRSPTRCSFSPMSWCLAGRGPTGAEGDRRQKRLPRSAGARAARHFRRALLGLLEPGLRPPADAALAGAQRGAAEPVDFAIS
jgi:hypothetical protein